jgi:hypothetical protein
MAHAGLTGRSRASELVVPAIMLATIGFYLWDAAGLSSAALIFPGALIAVILLGVAWAVGAAYLRPAGAAEPPQEDEPSGPIMSVKPWALVLLPAALVLVQPWIGALPAMIAIVFGAQMALGGARPLRSLAFAVLVTVPIYVLFAHFLYVRFPTGLLGIG